MTRSFLHMYVEYCLFDIHIFYVWQILLLANISCDHRKNLFGIGIIMLNIKINVVYQD